MLSLGKEYIKLVESQAVKMCHANGILWIQVVPYNRFKSGMARLKRTLKVDSHQLGRQTKAGGYLVQLETRGADAKAT